MQQAYKILKQLYQLFLQNICSFGQLAFKISCLVFMYNSALSKFINHGRNLGQFFRTFSLGFQVFKIADGVPGSFPLVPVTFISLSALPYVF